MKRTVAGYVGTLGGTILALLTLASLGQPTPNYLATAVLLTITLSMFGVGWYGLRVDRGTEGGVRE